MGFLLDLCCVAPPSLQEPKAVAELLGVRAVQHEPKSSRNGRITQVCVCLRAYVWVLVTVLFLYLLNISVIVLCCMQLSGGLFSLLLLSH